MKPGPLRDPTLPHQVVLSAGGQRNNHITVSCNCRLIPGRVSMGQSQPPSPDHYEPIAEVSNYDDTRQFYNDPDNHKTPFDPRVDGLRPWWEVVA